MKPEKGLQLCELSILHLVYYKYVTHYNRGR